MRDAHMAMLFLFVLILGFGVSTCTESRGQDGTHAQMHETYKGWSVPGNPNSSCCNAQTESGEGDCRPTRAYVDDDGWHAWNGIKWLLVPFERVLPTDYAGDGRSHLCEKGDYIYCFTPAPPRS